MENKPVDEFADFPIAGAASPEAVDEFADFPMASGEVTTTPEVMAQGAVGGAIESGTMLGGALLGAKAGAMGGPWGVAAGTIAGGAAGYFGGEKLRGWAAEQGWTFEDVEQLPEDQQASGVAGEVFGGALPFAATPVGFGFSSMRTAGVSKVGKWINDILETAKANPLRFLGLETSSAAGSAIGAYGAETYAPDNIPVRIGAEIAGGFFNPARVVNSAYEGTMNIVRSAYQKFSPAGRQTKAAQMIKEIIESGGEDSTAVLRMLEEIKSDPQFADMKLTVAQMTGSKQLGAIEKQLSAFSKNFGAQSQEQAENGTKALVGMMELLSRTGDPEALRIAAEIKRDLVKTSLSSRLQKAEKEARDAVALITKDTPANKAEISRAARGALDQSLKDARAAESELWSLVSKDVPATSDNLTARFTAIYDDMLPEARSDDLPGIAVAFIKRIKEEGVTSTDLVQFRSKMLSMSREASDAGRYNEARITGALADSALDDLDLAFAGDQAYDMARTFSRELNETFTRSFSGQAMATGRYGEKVPPELLLNRALANGGEAAQIQLADLEEATRFMVTRGLSDEKSFDVMMDAQERIVRLMAADAVDPTTGKVSAQKMNSFLRKNEALVNRFPGLKDQLSNAATTELGRQSMEAIAKRSSRIFESQTAFAKVLKQNPVKVAQAALGNSDQERLLTNLVKVAKTGKARKANLAALKTSVLDAAMRKSTTQSGNMNFDTLERLLTVPGATGQKSALDILVEAGAVTPVEVKNMKKIFELAKRISTAQKPGRAIDEIEDATGMVTDVITRGAGATIATKLAGVAGTEAASRGLIIAGAGSRAMRRLTQNLPTAAVKNIMIEMMSNPEFFKQVMTKTADEAADIQKFRSIHAYLIQAGIYNIKDTLESEQEPVSMSDAALSVL